MKVEHLLFGTAYYSEYLPYDRVNSDMEMMERAGMNVIRIAESTWSTLEPFEGKFDFSHLEQMLKSAKEHNLSVIIGTPTYAIPTWLAKKETDILSFTKNGQEIYGHRQNMDITSPTYLKYAERMIRTLLEYVQQYSNVIGFQLDNETKHYGTAGKRAQKMFVEELKKEYPDIEEFNHEFGLDYWSNRINCWDDFPDVRGTINESLEAEYAKFQRKLVTDFLFWQSQIVQEYKRPEQFITQNFDFEWHNYSYGYQPEVNQYEAAKCMTVAGADIYHPSQDLLTGAEITVCGNIARSLKQDNYLILETEAQGNPEWLPYPGQLRLQAYSHIANGSNSVMYWHWHSLHNAIESYWKGVLSHDFSENETYKEASIIGTEWKRIGSKLQNLKKSNRIGVLIDNESLTGLSCFPLETTGVNSYNTILRWLSDSLYRNNLEFDMVSSSQKDFGLYDCLIVPALYSASESLLYQLDAYVKNGGNLITTFKTAFSDEHLKIYADMQPHILHNCLGIHYDQFTYPKNVGLTKYDPTEQSTFLEPAKAREWMELLRCDTAMPIAVYDHPAWGKYAAITKNYYGKGTSLYLGCMFGDALLDEILIPYLKQILPADTFSYTNGIPYPVIVKKGTNDDGNTIVYYLNYSSEVQKIPYSLEQDGFELLTQAAIHTGESLIIDPWGLAIIEL